MNYWYCPKCNAKVEVELTDEKVWRGLCSQCGTPVASSQRFAASKGTTYSGMNEIDVTQFLTKAHNGQPTPGVHTVTVYTTS